MRTQAWPRCRAQGVTPTHTAPRGTRWGVAGTKRPQQSTNGAAGAALAWAIAGTHGCAPRDDGPHVYETLSVPETKDVCRLPYYNNEYPTTHQSVGSSVRRCAPASAPPPAPPSAQRRRSAAVAAWRPCAPTLSIL